MFLVSGGSKHEKVFEFFSGYNCYCVCGCSAQKSELQADSVHARESVGNSEDEPESVITEVVFPAYQDGKNENDGTVYDLEPFVVAAVFPEGWQVRSPDTKSDDTFAFYAYGYLQWGSAYRLNWL